MELTEITRRNVLKGGGAAIAGLTLLRIAGPVQAFPAAAADETVLLWDDQPAANPVPDVVGHPLVWEHLSTRMTPLNEFFTVKHYNQPAIDAASWRLPVDGHVSQPQSLSIADLRSRARQEVEFTLECSGNTGLPFLIGAVGNARWAGTPLANVLRRAGIKSEAVEVVFWGADSGKVKVGGGWSSGPGSEVEITEQFARSMSIADAMAPDNLLCFEMNGAPLPAEHGAPVRLIAPGWYGVANVKWLTHIEVIDHRYAGRFMARDYVTIREEQREGKAVWTFATVGHSRLKSAPVRVTRAGNQYKAVGAAWGAPIGRVEVRIDSGPWQAATLTNLGDGRARASRSGFTWSFWTYNWGGPTPGKHTVTSRAFDTRGNEQPAPTDTLLAAKRTYWESNGQITRTVTIP